MCKALTCCYTSPLGRDTIVPQVRLQTQIKSAAATYKGPIHCARSIMQLEGFRAFYKGMVGGAWRWESSDRGHDTSVLGELQVAPIVSNAPINAIVFGTERTIMRQLRRNNQWLGLDPVLQHMVAGERCSRRHMRPRCAAADARCACRVDGWTVAVLHCFSSGVDQSAAAGRTRPLQPSVQGQHGVCTVFGAHAGAACVWCSSGPSQLGLVCSCSGGRAAFGVCTADSASPLYGIRYGHRRPLRALV